MAMLFLSDKIGKDRKKKRKCFDFVLEKLAVRKALKVDSDGEK